MNQLKDYLPRERKPLTPEQIAAIEERKRVERARQIGMCSPDCETCQGIGWVRIEDDPSRPARVELCQNVDKWRLPISVRFGISREEADQLSWSKMVNINGVGEAVKVVCETLARGFGWVYLHGSYGLGKTEILKIAVAQTLRENKDASYTRMAEVLDHLREGFEGGESETARLRWWSEIQLLAIDEFERVRDTGYGQERRFVLMDRRYEMAIREQGVTLIASNTKPEMLPGYLSDRIRDGRFRVVELSGASARPGMEW